MVPVKADLRHPTLLKSMDVRFASSPIWGESVPLTAVLVIHSSCRLTSFSKCPHGRVPLRDRVLLNFNVVSFVSPPIEGGMVPGEVGRNEAQEWRQQKVRS